MPPRFLKGIFDNFVWLPIRRYRQICLDAKEAEYKFNLYLDTGMLTFPSKDVEILEDRVIFKKKGKSIHTSPYRRMERPQPLLRDKKLDVVIRRPIQPIYVLIPLLLFLLGTIALFLSTSNINNEELNDLISPPSKLSGISYYFYTFDEYDLPSNNEITNTVQQALTSQSLSWAAAVLFFLGIVLLAWTYILFATTDKLDRRIISLEPTRQNPAIQSGGKTRFELFIEFSKAFVWPFVVAVLLLVFFSPIRQLVDIIPKKFANASEIGFGSGFYLKVQEVAKTSEDKQIATEISGLSQGAIKTILEMGNGSRGIMSTDKSRDVVGVENIKSFSFSRDDLSIWKELEQKGLLKIGVDEGTQEYGNLSEFEQFVLLLHPIMESSSNRYRIPTSGLSQDIKNKLLNADIRLTDSGKGAYSIIIDAVVSLIEQK